MATKKLLTEFDHISKDEWITKVTKDLKGKSIDTLNSHILGDKVISPFFHSDDVKEDVSLPPRGTPPIMLGYDIRIQEEKKSNHLILEALSGGVRFLNIYLPRHVKINFDVLFDRVLLDLLYVTIHCEEETTITLCKDYIDRSYDRPLHHMWFVHDNRDNWFRSDVWSHPLTDLLVYGSEQLSSSHQHERIFFYLEAGHDYISNICIVRAARLLWANLLLAHGYEHDSVRLMILGSISSKIFSPQPHDNIISMTQVSTGLISAGVDVIMIPHADVLTTPIGSDETRRLSRNIYNVLSLEGHMCHVEDPAAGSYLFDSMTLELAIEHWDDFVNTQKI